MFMKYISLVFVALFGMASLVACNTVKGAGEDVESVGDSVADSVD